jgi:hypothetical protein
MNIAYQSSSNRDTQMSMSVTRVVCCGGSSVFRPDHRGSYGPHRHDRMHGISMTSKEGSGVDTSEANIKGYEGDSD